MGDVGTLRGLRVMSGCGWSPGLELRRDTGSGVISEQMVFSPGRTGWQVPGGKMSVWKAGGDLDRPVGVTSPEAPASRRREGAEKV